MEGIWVGSALPRIIVNLDGNENREKNNTRQKKKQKIKNPQKLEPKTKLSHWTVSLLASWVNVELLPRSRIMLDFRPLVSTTKKKE